MPASTRLSGEKLATDLALLAADAGVAEVTLVARLEVELLLAAFALEVAADDLLAAAPVVFFFVSFHFGLLGSGSSSGPG